MLLVYLGVDIPFILLMILFGYFAYIAKSKLVESKRQKCLCLKSLKQKKMEDDSGLQPLALQYIWFCNYFQCWPKSLLIQKQIFILHI